jgi:hypothetical protein
MLNMDNLEALKYPIGKYNPPEEISAAQLDLWIDDLSKFPAQLDLITSDLNESALEKQYRPGGWTVRQVVHHLADSHINAYMRFHLTLTEDKPNIRPYFEERWAELSDGKTGEISFSIHILNAIHQRLVFLLRNLEVGQFNRSYFHPETKKEYTMAYLLGNYAWHGKHHLAHIKSTLI